MLSGTWFAITANIQHMQYCVGDNESNVLRLLIKGKLHVRAHTMFT